MGIFLPADVIMVILVVGMKVWLECSGHRRPQFLGSPMKIGPWTAVVILWDFVDLGLFAWWYVDAKPGRNQADRFEEDFLVAYLCCGMLWVGPCLPLAALLLSRKRYCFLQVIYDALELFLVAYTDAQFDFKAVGKWATAANYWSTIIDGLIFKGPQFWHTLICENDEDDDEERMDKLVYPE